MPANVGPRALWTHSAAWKQPCLIIHLSESYYASMNWIEIYIRREWNEHTGNQESDERNAGGQRKNTFKS